MAASRGRRPQRSRQTWKSEQSSPRNDAVGWDHFRAYSAPPTAASPGRRPRRSPRILAPRSLTANGTTVLAGTGAGVFRSTDDGLTWTAAATQPTNALITALTANGTTFLAGTNGAGRVPLHRWWRHLDGGHDAAAEPSIPSLAASGTTLLAGTDGSGVFRSTDGGLTWTAATTQPRDLYIHPSPPAARRCWPEPMAPACSAPPTAASPGRRPRRSRRTRSSSLSPRAARRCWPGHWRRRVPLHRWWPHLDRRHDASANRPNHHHRPCPPAAQRCWPGPMTGCSAPPMAASLWTAATTQPTGPIISSPHRQRYDFDCR